MNRISSRLKTLTGAVAVCMALTATGLAQQWKFLVYGDSRGNSSSVAINTNILSELVAATISEAPAFVLVPGDLVFSGSTASFSAWTNIMGPVYQSGISVYPIIGNHDADSISAYTSIFGPDIPDNGPAGEINRTFSFVHSNALIIGLDNYAVRGKVNQAWLDGVLASNYMPHVFAFGHLPAFKVNHSDTLDDHPADRDAFWTSLGNAGAQAYFCGHDHFYDHARLDDGDGNPGNDVHQFIVGTAGAPITSDGSYNGSNGKWTPVRQFHEGAYGYMVVEVDGLDVTYTWKHRMAAGEYSAGADTRTAHVAPEVSWLEIADATPAGLSVMARSVTPSASNTVEWTTDLLAGVWQPYTNFVTFSNTYLLNLSSAGSQVYFRVRSE